MARDATSADASSDAMTRDAVSADATSVDATSVDAASVDAASVDAASADATSADARTDASVMAGDTSTPSCASSYSTTFDLTESPISEAGHWSNVGLDWTHVVTAGGIAYGTQSNAGSFDDSYARLTGTWPPNQEVSAIVHKGATGGIMEVELHVRVTESAHDVQLYEVNFAHDGQYVDFVRWHGALGTSPSDFTYLVPTLTYHVSGGIHDGDELRVRIVGNVITAFVNGTQVGTATDTAGPGGGAVLTSGSPGFGFYRSGGTEMVNYGFTSLTACAH